MLEGLVDGRAQRLDVLVEVNGSDGALGNALRSELEFLKIGQRSATDCDAVVVPGVTHLVHVFVRATGTESV